MNKTKALLDALLAGNEPEIQQAFDVALKEKIKTEMEIRKVALGSKFFTAPSK